MKKASEYHVHAGECRALAAKMQTGEHRDQLFSIAEMWERLAEDRSDLVRKHPELDRAPGEAHHDQPTSDVEERQPG